MRSGVCPSPSPIGQGRRLLVVLFCHWWAGRRTPPLGVPFLVPACLLCALSPASRAGQGRGPRHRLRFTQQYLI
ncbi:hypothetical protein SORBI_3003G042800 [Sorghum bicolor]|uniref:Uncharacterized protein n=1 Tax=Sorghum bicolor TaxID=4558 RepID=A0A1B6Q196_SORBI|nr:hypothetical protein SORBI_3003G042800 [Sorghum bicolor]